MDGTNWHTHFNIVRVSMNQSVTTNLELCRTVGKGGGHMDWRYLRMLGMWAWTVHAHWKLCNKDAVNFLVNFAYLFAYLFYSINQHASVILQQSYKQNLWRNAFWDSSDKKFDTKQFSWVNARPFPRMQLFTALVFAALLQKQISV